MDVKTEECDPNNLFNIENYFTGFQFKLKKERTQSLSKDLVERLFIQCFDGRGGPQVYQEVKEVVTAIAGITFYEEWVIAFSGLYREYGGVRDYV